MGWLVIDLFKGVFGLLTPDDYYEAIVEEISSLSSQISKIRQKASSRDPYQSKGLFGWFRRNPEKYIKILKELEEERELEIKILRNLVKEYPELKSKPGFTDVFSTYLERKISLKE